MALQGNFVSSAPRKYWLLKHYMYKSQHKVGIERGAIRRHWGLRRDCRHCWRWGRRHMAEREKKDFGIDGLGRGVLEEGLVSDEEELVYLL